MRGYGRETRESITTCCYTDEVTDLLARRIREMPEYTDCEIQAMGPFGFGARCSVSVKRGDDLLGFLTVGYGPGEDAPFTYVDYSAPKKDIYPERSIGDWNGLNYVTHTLPTDINEVLRLVFKRSEK